MHYRLPTPADVAEMLSAMEHRQIAQLSKLSGVPVPTLWHLRGGAIANPGLATVGKFLPHIKKAKSF
jgi:hypothetical protein